MPIELESRLDLLILAQGAVIGLWTTASFGLARHGASKSALWFGWAGAAWLLVGFSQILLLNHILPMLLEPLLMLSLAISFNLLLEGSRRALREDRGWMIPVTVHALPPLFYLFWMVYHGAPSLAGLWILGGGFVGAVATVALWCRRSQVRGYEARLAALGLGGYMLTRSIGALDGQWQAQATLAGAGLLLPLAIRSWSKYQRVHAAAFPSAPRRPWQWGATSPFVLVATVVVLGWLAAEWRAARSEHRRRDEIALRAQLAAAAVPNSLLQQLEGTFVDAEKPAYHQLKKLMSDLRAANPDLRFVLLSKWHEGEVRFLVDSEPAGSPDYSPPGDVYSEAPLDYAQAMREARSFVLGPITDRWGTWIIASAPIGHGVNPAHMEFNVAAHDWAGQVRLARLPSLLVTVCVLGMLMTTQQARDRVRLALLHLRTAKDSAETANRAKSEFLAVMSHEIRTPLGAVIGLLELLRHDPPLEERKRYATLARGSAESLLSILDDILDSSKVESGKLSLEEIPFVVRPELGRVLGAMGIRAREKHLYLHARWATDLPRALRGDPTRLKQVLTNLLNNAIKFTSRGGITVTIGGAPRDDGHWELDIQVSDTGVGIPAEVLPKIFGRFEQADASTTRQFGGTGLGLSIVHGLLQQMGGRISCTSTPGQGSTFHVHLPLPAAGPEEAPDPTEEESPEFVRSLTPLRILCAEDDEVHREYLGATLRLLGHQVAFAHDGPHALERLAAERFDVVLMDQRMPGMDGLQTVRTLRGGGISGADTQLYVIGLTANVTAQDRRDCLAAGMNDFLPKPARPHELQVALERFYRHFGRHSPGAGNEPTAEELWEMSAPPIHEAALTAPSPELAGLFVRETGHRLQLLQEAHARADLPAVAEVAHRIKGTCKCVGEVELGRLASELESLAHAGTDGPLPSHLARLQDEFVRSGQRLAALASPTRNAPS